MTRSRFCVGFGFALGSSNDGIEPSFEISNVDVDVFEAWKQYPEELSALADFQRTPAKDQGPRCISKESVVQDFGRIED